jgi:hypothetical protein
LRWTTPIAEAISVKQAFSAGMKQTDTDFGRILMLTLLAPDIVEAIMEGRQPTDLGVLS